MAYPTDIANLTNPISTDATNSATVPHATEHATANNEIVNIETFVGVTGSADAASLVNRVAALEAIFTTTGAWTNGGTGTAWNAVTTNPAIGNGTFTGLSAKVGKTLTLRINIAMGSTTTYGTGQWILWTGYTSASTAPQGISGWAYRSSTGATYPVFLEISASTTNSQIRIADGVTTGYVTPTAPFAWAAGDYLRLEGSIEIQ